MIRTIAETGSTNTDMLAAAAAGEPEGSWLRTERQTAGRGRMGRSWSEFDGNLYTSTIVRPMVGNPPTATLGFVAAVALDEVLCAFAPDAQYSFKWPNDVLASGAKLSGILLESTGEAVVIGFGVNLASHPEGLDRPVTSVRAVSGTAPDAAIFLEHLSKAFARWLSRWRGEGLACILAQWTARAHPIGQALSVHLAQGESFEGLYTGLDSDGALLLQLADGTVRTVHAGDVFLV